MAGLVFIHGAWLGGWCFAPVRRLLEAGGHSVDTPDLPGTGEPDGEGAEPVTLADWAAFAAARCHAMRAKQQGPVVLVGHSRGGLVLSQAAELTPDAMDGLIYVSGMMLPGGSVRRAWEAHLAGNPLLSAMVRPTADGRGTTIDPARFPQGFAQRARREDAEAMALRLTREPDSIRETTLRLTADRFGSVPRSYICCTEDRVISLADQRGMIARLPGTEAVEIPADHSPFLCAPEILANALIELAR
jgi:pimeloyl-ACP methyl ester carboxylesterase